MIRHPPVTDAGAHPDDSKPRLRELVPCSLVSGGALVVLYVGLNPRNHALLEQGYAFFQPETRLDAWVPLWTPMVWPYYMYFPLIASALFLESRRRQWLYEGVIGYVGVAFLGFCSFLLLPSRMNQPDLHACGTAACKALQAMYDLDQGFHVFPSMHVAISVYTALFWRARAPRYWHLPGLLALAITASTVLCKRHYLPDIPAGIMVALAVRPLAVAAGPRVARLMRWAA